MVNFLFSKELRLSTSSHFTYVLQQPQQQARTKKIVILSRLNMLGYPRIGLTISKKNVKHAHERNRIKRLIRESFRIRQHKLPPMDFIILVKKGVDDLDNYALLEMLKKLWHYFIV